MNFLDKNHFDLVGLQEIKMLKEQADFKFPKYHCFWNSADKKGYSGTLVLSRQKPLSVQNGLGIEEHDKEGRVITLEFEKFYFVNVYTPNSKRGLLRLDYRKTWDDTFREYLCKLDKPVIVCGDLNVAHKEIDLANPSANTRNPGFTDEEREKFTKLLEAGFVDTFRHLNPSQKEAYTWWSYMGQARERNVGWRIDYFLVSEFLKESIKEAKIYERVFGSDHCPVGLEMEMEGF